MAITWEVSKARADSIVIRIERNASGVATGATVVTEGWGIDQDQGAMLQLTRTDNYVDLPAAVQDDIREVVKTATKGLSQLINETDEDVLP